jgi:putative FmdB family regulatory protein
MPLYEFFCRACGRTFEQKQTLEEHERELPECPACKSAAEVERLISAFYAKTSRKG